MTPGGHIAHVPWTPLLLVVPVASVIPGLVGQFGGDQWRFAAAMAVVLVFVEWSHTRRAKFMLTILHRAKLQGDSIDVQHRSLDGKVIALARDINDPDPEKGLRAKVQLHDDELLEMRVRLHMPNPVPHHR